MADPALVAGQLMLLVRKIETWPRSMRLPCETWLADNHAAIVEALTKDEA